MPERYALQREIELLAPEAAVLHEAPWTTPKPPPKPPMAAEQLPAPANRVPLAEPPSPGSYWPLKSAYRSGREVAYRAADGKIVGTPRRMFMVGRRGKRGGKPASRWHLGIDLFCDPGDPVVACESGEIVGWFYMTTSEKKKTPAYGLLVEHGQVVVNYGEVSEDSLRSLGLTKETLASARRSVRAGDVIGFVSDTSMLHFETWTKGTRTRAWKRQWWKDESEPPPGLLNPTAYLLYLMEHGLPRTAEAPPAGLLTGRKGPISTLSQHLLDALRAGLITMEVALALATGERDPDRLASLVFHTRHSGRGGKAIQPDETHLAQEWLQIRDRLIVPALRALATAARPVVTSIASLFPTGVPPLGGAKVPTGFRDKKKGGVTVGLARCSKERLDRTLLALRAQGVISTSDDDIDTFQRIANVETGGAAQCLNTWDSGVVSIGFMQWTLRHRKAQRWIRQAEKAFERHGVVVDKNRTYEFRAGKGKVDKVQAIQGAATADELRWDGWAERFYNAGLDPEIIAAEVKLAKVMFDEALKSLRTGLKDDTAFAAFEEHYQASTQIRAIFQEAYNNMPVAGKGGTLRAIRRAQDSGVKSTAAFLEVLQEEIINAYGAKGKRQKGVNVVEKTRTGAQFS